jgi:hypothetical protein
MVWPTVVLEDTVARDSINTSPHPRASVWDSASRLRMGGRSVSEESEHDEVLLAEKSELGYS